MNPSFLISDGDKTLWSVKRTVQNRIIQASMTTQWTMVGLSLSVKLVHAEPWMKVVEHLSTYLQDTSIAMFVQIWDLLIVNHLPELPLLLILLLWDVGPYVRFLPEASLFQAGQFPNLVEFMHGFASDFNPRARAILTGRQSVVWHIYETGRSAAATVNREMTDEILVTIESAKAAAQDCAAALQGSGQNDGWNGMDAFLFGAIARHIQRFILGINFFHFIKKVIFFF